MRERVFYGRNDIRYLYFKFKDSPYYSITLIIFIIFVCLLLILSVIMPQASHYFSVRNEIIAQREKIRIINENTNFISNLNKEELNNQLMIASSALPSEKDVSGILNSLSDASIKSGVSIDDFSFNLGQVASPSANLSQIVESGIESVEIMIRLTGEPERISLFIKEINQNFPLAEVVEAQSSVTFSSVKIKFYYKPYPEIKLNEEIPFTSLSPEKKKVFDVISAWDVTAAPDLETPISTSSAPLFE